GSIVMRPRVSVTARPRRALARPPGPRRSIASRSARSLVGLHEDVVRRSRHALRGRIPDIDQRDDLGALARREIEHEVVARAIRQGHAHARAAAGFAHVLLRERAQDRVAVEAAELIGHLDRDVTRVAAPTYAHLMALVELELDVARGVL